MSSSVFAESPVSTNESRMCGDSNSNLVVVYGKNGINVDREGLETLIDEKKVSSISVVRLTSPTPSMKDEKDDVECNDENLQEGVDLSNLKISTKKDGPEIVGLTIEEFYPADEAKKVARDVMNYAGVVNPVHVKVDYEFQRFVIQNDHCYTPLTSPSQVKQKTVPVPSANPEVVKPTMIKQYTNSKLKKSVDIIEIDDKSEKETEEEEEGSDYTESSLSDSDNDRDSDLDFNVNDRQGKRRKAGLRRARKSVSRTSKKRHSVTESTSGIEEEKKNITSRVYNRLSFDQRKTIPTTSTIAHKTSAKTVPVTKSQPNIQTQQIQTMQSAPKVVVQQQPQLQSQQSQVQQPQQVKIIQSGSNIADSEKAEVQLQMLAQTARPRAVFVANSQPEPPRPMTVQKFLLIKKEHKKTEGGFTDISTFLTQGDNNKSNVKVTELKFERSIPIQPQPAPQPQPLPQPQPQQQSQLQPQHQIQHQSQLQPQLQPQPQPQPQPVILHPPPTKGFMPLESAAKGQLPAQISIQTHTSSTELAAEHDKQLDLIDSIVKDEMEKSNVIVKNTMNENIPQLVKMLESTEKAVLGKTKSTTPVEMPRLAPPSSTSSTYTTTGVEDIDITNAPLLENAEDDLTDDLLQHVAELMDNKNLQEVVEKQVLTPEPLPQQVSPSVDTLNRGPLATADPSAVIPPPLSTIPTISQDSTLHKSIASSTTQLQTPPSVKKEPIQIVRGDGRVITLPPIEAPTTRAKRRAQTQVVPPLATSTPTQASKLATAGKSEGSGSRRNSNEQKSAAGSRKRSSVSSQSAPKEDYTTTENESDEEDDSEDDPDKLWCICRQPHNNRFMICCDVCEDWFHGTCVNITKAMGLEMEANGIEWTCPKCMKKQEPNQRKAIQRKITEIFDKKQQQQQQIGEEPKKIQIESRRTTPTVSTIKKVDSKKATESPTTSKVENKREAQKKSTETGVAKKLPDMFKREAQKKQTAEIHHRKSTENVHQKTTQSQNVQQSQESGQQQVVKNSDMPEIKTIEIIRSGQDDRGKLSEGQSGKLIIVPPGSGHSKVREGTMTTCIVCKKMSRPNSIYCSDDCIRQHAQNALISKNKASKASSTTVAPDDKKKKAFSSFEEALAKASETTFQVKNKVERVYVFERKTGRILTGSNAPTTANLKKWLQDNPTFEVVQPGSPQALTIERIKQQKTKGSNSSGVTSTAPSSSSSSESSPSVQYTPVKKAHSHIKMMEAHKLTSSKLHKYPQQISVKQGSSPQTTYLLSPTESKDSREFKDAKETKESKREHTSKEKDTPTKQSLKKQSSVEQPKTPQPTTPTSEVEPVRLHMKRTLKEQLISRMNEVKNPNAPKLSLEEMEQFANETENEMFKLFNKDTGAKYKAKYRSLMFNIKDRKNETLFQKICEKKIEPKQLVRMSPEELASQELAQWRQNENKHQLEMIKKSELDLLSCAKNYVLKTHKGEEVIESKSTDRVSLDISIPVEDVVAVLNNSTVSSTSDELPPTPSSTSTSKEVYKLSNSLDTSDIDSNIISSDSKVGSTVTLQSPTTSVDSKKIENFLATFNKEREKSKEKDRAKDMDKEKDVEKEKEREREKNKDKEKHKERERHHTHKSNQKDKMKSKKRSRSRSRSREKEHRHKSPHKEDRRDSITTSSKDKDKDSKIKEKDREPPSKKEKLSIEVKSKPQIVTKPVSAKPKDPRRSSKTDSTEIAKVEDYNLIDKILESTKTVEEAANLVNEKEKEKEKAAAKQTNSNTKPSSSTSTQKPVASARPSPTQKVAETTSAGDSDQEPTSTVTIATPPEDQYQRYSSDLSSIIWSGSINMIDVATFQIIIQPVCGVSVDLERDLPSELDIVGRISPDTVWDYIAKIKKSPNKEVVIIRLVPSSSSENIAYSALYMYLDKRKRLGVVKTTSTNIKDFYILPLTSKKLLPPVLQPVNNVEFFEDDSRPDLLVGIVIRIMGKRPAPPAPPHTSSKVMRKTVEQSVISSSAPATSSEERFTPPDSPKNFPLKKLEKSIISAGRLPPKVNSPIDIDAVIAPVASKRKAQIATDDADEPYSPGGSSDDDIMSTVPPIATNPSSTTIDPIADELKRINRQIEAQQMEIVGILSGDQEIAAKSPYTTSAAAATATLGPALANISIPSNLQQILASIQSKPEAAASSTNIPPPPVIGSLLASNSVNDDEEYTPQPAPSYKPTTAISEMVNNSTANPPLALGAIPPIAPPRSTPALSAVDFGKKQDVDMRIGLLEDPNLKKSRWDNQQPPPPGLEDEFL